MANVWCADDTYFGDLIFLNDQNLIVDSPDKDSAPGIRDALLQGQNPVALLSSDAENIPLLSVTRVSTDRHDEDIEIKYKNGKETEEKTLQLSSPEKRDEVFAVLKNIYGDKFREFEDAKSVPETIYAALASLTIFGLLTWLFASAAAEIRVAEEVEISGSRRGLKAIFLWILDFLGPIGVSVIGGFICLLFTVAIYAGIKRPPVMLILQQETYKPQSKIKLLLKYGVLGVIWFFALKVVLL